MELFRDKSQRIHSSYDLDLLPVHTHFAVLHVAFGATIIDAVLVIAIRLGVSESARYLR